MVAKNKSVYKIILDSKLENPQWELKNSILCYKS